MSSLLGCLGFIPGKSGCFGSGLGKSNSPCLGSGLGFLLTSKPNTLGILNLPFVVNIPPGSNLVGGIALKIVAGGFVGNQFGKGDGNKAATALGAAIGAVKGSQTGQSKQIVGYQNVNQCHTEYTNTTSSVVNEYDITYNVNGTYVTMRVNKAVGNNTWVGKTQRFRINYQLIN